MIGVAFTKRYWCAFFAVTTVLATAVARLSAADLPVKRIVLYKHGIAFFERRGRVPDGDDVHLDFKAADMNDVLKSLIVTDSSGSKISGIRFDSNATLEQQLSQFSFNIGQQESLSAFLDRLRGARIELKSEDKTAAGVIFGARAASEPKKGDSQASREQVTVLLDSGELKNFDLNAVTALTFPDAKLQSELRQYLSTVAQSKTRDKRTVYLDTSGTRGRDLMISYVTPAAIWKSSYRLSLAETGSQLEGWAIVDNTTDEDWNGVNLSVVSGRPISFISLLDTPRYGQRQIAELPEDRAAGPQVYGATVEQFTVLGGVGGVLGGVTGGVAGAAVGSGSGEGTYRTSADKQSVANQLVAPRPIPAQSSMVATAAIGASLGELFEYRFAGPVSIRKQQSAMLPFLQSKVSARKLLIYTEQDGEHPVNAAEVTNTTAKTLDGGPMTVFDSDAYAGEALFETVKAGAKRLIGYAVDYGTNITTAFTTAPRTIRELHVRDGVAQLAYREHLTRTYNLRNTDAKAKTLVIQQEGLQDYTVLAPTPSERTSTAYRFEVKLPANGSRMFQVEEERTYFNSIALMESTPDSLIEIVDNKDLSPAGRAQLKIVLDAKSALNDLIRRLDFVKSQVEDASNDQARIRKNIDSLNQVKGEEQQVRIYVSQLAQTETGLNELRTAVRELSERKPALESAVKASIQKLQF